MNVAACVDLLKTQDAADQMEVELTVEDQTGEQDESYETAVPFVKFSTESLDVSTLSALSDQRETFALQRVIKHGYGSGFFFKGFVT